MIPQNTGTINRYLSPFTSFTETSPVPPKFSLAPILLAESYRQRRAVLTTERTSHLPRVAPSILKAAGGSAPDTFFILGSGESVLELSSAQWSHVRAAVSAGIGAWTIHPFVPDFLALEHIEREPERDGLLDGETGLERSYRQALEGWQNRPEVRDIQPRILFFRPPKVSDLSRLQPLGDYWVNRTFLYGRLGSSSRNLADLEREIILYLRLARAGVIPFWLPFDTGATLIRLIFLAAISGYQNIVLAGVDLRDSRFFWESQPSLLVERGMSSFFTSERGSKHSTEMTGSFPVSEVLPMISSLLKILLGTRLSVAHESSWVSTILPVFDWTQMNEERD